jgi:hypothetical protein
LEPELALLDEAAETFEAGCLFASGVLQQADAGSQQAALSAQQLLLPCSASTGWVDITPKIANTRAIRVRKFFMSYSF